MRCNSRRMVWRWLMIAGGLAALPVASALAVTATVSFQNGLDGYGGTFDRVIDDRGGLNEVDGSTVVQYGLDGFGTGSPDRQGLLRFDNLIGNGPGQIPSGAFIVDAQLQVTTTWGGNAQTNGPWGVSGLLAPINSSTVYASFPGGRGPWYQDGTATRAVGNYGGALGGDVLKAKVTSLVQSWADGSLANNGMTIQAGFTGTTDGWNIYTTGHGMGADYDFHEWRPKLSVTYATDPVEINTFQRDLNGYAGDTMVHLIGGTNLLGANPADDDETIDGLTLAQAFLDGPDIEGSADNAALIKFANVFGAGAGQAPTDVPVAKAWLVMTTGDLSADARTTGGYSAHRLLSDWNTTTLHSDLDLGTVPIDGSRVGDDISLALDTQRGVITGSEVWFDVTSYLEGVRNGAADFGLAVLAGTSDGWQVHFNGSGDALARPRLVVASGMVSIVNPTLSGDYNGDGIVDAADYTVWRDNLGSSHNLAGNGDETGGSGGIVDQADYSLWKSNFGAVADGGGGPLGAAVPEPCSLWIAAAGLLGMIAAGRRK